MDNKNIFVTGSRGMIGSRLIEKGCSPFVSDVTDIVAIDKEISQKKPKIIIHLAYKTNVNFCETTANLDACYKVNLDGSRNVFSMAEKHNVPVVFISSDHIFSGKWLGNYKETLEGVAPRNQYGNMKLMTEAIGLPLGNVKVIRTSVLFYKTREMVYSYIRELSKGNKVYPPIFLWRSFMHMNHFASSLIAYADRFYEMPKVLNISGCENVSWTTFIRSYAEMLELDTKLVIPRFTDNKSPLDADRPHRAGLNTKLSAELGFTQYSYLDGIKEDI